MNNTSVQDSLEDCKNELDNILTIIDSMGRTANFVPYLTKYSIIKACGTIERAYKDIISDYCIISAPTQVANYIEKSFRESSSNPSLDNIHSALKKFDSLWQTTFKNNLNTHENTEQLKTSIASLVQLRNNLSHGGNPTSSIDDVINYYRDSYVVIKLLDNVVR